LKNFFDPSRALLTPSDIVMGFTGKNMKELSLPARAIIVFNTGDLKKIASKKETIINEAWQPFRSLYHITGSNTVMTQCSIGGPGVAALVEELAAFGVSECALWGYCGAISDGIDIGDVIIAKSALREEGVSHHYTEKDDDFIESNWFEKWVQVKDAYNFHDGAIWSTDAIYRETGNKVSRFREKGVLGVEMETASFYAVCRYIDIKGIAFLVVSDAFRGDTWKSGFHTKPFKEGIKRLTKFVLEMVIS